MQNILWQLGRGTLAGVIATLPMTIAMVLMHRYLPGNPQKQLPPVHITEAIAENTPLENVIIEPTLSGGPLLAHYAYGGVAGSLLLPVTQKLPIPTFLRGGLYGLLIWTGNYVGLLPALRLYPHAKDEPARMNGLMISAHFIWGGIAALLADRQKQSSLSHQ